MDTWLFLDPERLYPSPPLALLCSVLPLVLL